MGPSSFLLLLRGDPGLFELRFSALNIDVLAVYFRYDKFFCQTIGNGTFSIRLFQKNKKTMYVFFRNTYMVFYFNHVAFLWTLNLDY